MTLADLPLLLAAGVVLVAVLIVSVVLLYAVADRVAVRRTGGRLQFDLLGELPMCRGRDAR